MLIFRGSRRLLVSATLATSMVGASSFAEQRGVAQDGIVFVGDQDPAQVSTADGPKLPTLRNGQATATGDVRYAPVNAQMIAAGISKPGAVQRRPVQGRTQAPAQSVAQAKPKGFMGGLFGIFGEEQSPQDRVAVDEVMNSQLAPHAQVVRSNYNVSNNRQTDQQVQSTSHTNHRNGQRLQTRNGSSTPQGIFGGNTTSKPQPTPQQASRPRQMNQGGKPMPIAATTSPAATPKATLFSSQRQPAEALRPMPLPMERTSTQATIPNTTAARQMPSGAPIFVSDDDGTVASTNKPLTPLPVTTYPSPEMEVTVAAASSDHSLALLPKEPAVQQAVAPTPSYVQSRNQSAQPLVIHNPAAQQNPNRKRAHGNVTNPVVVNPVPVEPIAAAESPVDQPSPRAIALLGEANTFSQAADTEEKLSQVVQMCNHVLAIDSTPQVVAYANQLAGWALNRRGEMRSDAGRTKEALVDFEAAIRIDANRWRAIHNRGVLRAQEGQFAAAFDDFNRTIEIEGKFAKAYSNRAALYVQAGDLEAALDDYRSAIQLDPDLAIAHKGRGRACHTLGRMEEAIRHFEAAVILAPEDAHIAVGRADLLVDMGRYGEAIQGYQDALRISPQHAVACRNLAWVQATCPDESFRSVDEALTFAQRAVELTAGQDDLALDTLAAAQANQGDFRAAQVTLEKALLLAPKSDKTAYEQRLALYKQGQPFRSAPASAIQPVGFSE